MGTGCFEYQGYHFEAVGVLSDGLEGKELVAQTRSNTELHLSTYHTEDFPKYSYDEFYAVSNAPDADIFRCLETGKTIFREKMSCLAMRENFNHISDRKNKDCDYAT